MTTTAARKTTTAAKATVVAPAAGAEIGVVGRLRKGVHAHRITGTEPAPNDHHHWAGDPVAACNRKPVTTHSYGFASTVGVVLCRNCFGGDRK